MRKSQIVVALISLIQSTSLFATETVTYTYDAQGRLIKSVVSGTVNNGTTTVYTHDKADNRKNVTVTGAPH